MKIDKLIDEFCKYKQNIEGRSKSSMNIYKNHIEEFCKDMEIKDYNTLINIKAQVIKDWVDILVDKGNVPTTRNNKLTCIKQLFLFLEDEKEIEIDRHINKIKFAKIPQKETKYADEITMDRLLDKITDIRVKAGVAIIESTGVRFSELIQITCEDIKRGYSIVVGKGNKEREISFSPNCIKLCNIFIDGKRKKIIDKTGVDTDLLFISNNGKLISLQSFSTSLKYYARKMGLSWYKEMSPHKLRHGFVTKQLNKGVPIQIVRDAVGHSSISTTNRYAHGNKEDVRRIMVNDDWKASEDVIYDEF